MDLRETGWEFVAWVYLFQHREEYRALVNTVMDLQFPQKARNFLTS